MVGVYFVISLRDVAGVLYVICSWRTSRCSCACGSGSGAWIGFACCNRIE